MHQWDVAPIAMPITANSSRIYSFDAMSELDYAAYKGLPYMLADSLPDNFGNTVINHWLQSQGRLPESFTPVERLCYTGTRGIGALEYFPVLGGLSTTSVKLQVNKLVHLADIMLSERSDFKTVISEGEDAVKAILLVGTSAGGARPKAIIAYNETTGEIRSGQVDAPEGFSHWLLKIDGVNDFDLGATKNMGRIEYAYYLMAKDCGIEMSDCRLLEEGGRAHFMTRRFDRIGNNKLHMQSINAIAGMNYKNGGMYSYEQVFTLLRKMKLSYPEIEQQFRRMILNYLSKNCDDHTKNISLLMNRQGVWSLSPAYDVCYAYNAGGRYNYQHFLSVNGKFNNVNRADLLRIGDREGIKDRESIYDRIQNVVSKWEKYAENAGLSSHNTLVQNIGKMHSKNLIK
jgi:serine/threonine-protein kinase HipA